MSERVARNQVEGIPDIVVRGIFSLRRAPARLCESCRFAVRPTLVMWLVFLVGASAIILANFNYIDDMGRVADGYKGWDDFSRYTSNFLSGFMHADDYLTDVSPLTQMVAALELAVASVATVYVITGRRSLTVWLVAAVLPLGLSPYFLECLSYKYDSPYMALSVLASVLPLLLARRGWLPYGLAVIAGELVVCTTYQAATGILPLLVIVVALRQWSRGRSTRGVLGFVFFSAGAYLVALVVFKLFIMQPATSYVSNEVPPINELLMVFASHLKQYVKYVLADFKKPWIVLVALVILAFVWVVVRDARRNRVAVLFVTLACVALMGCLTFGIYPALDQPLFSPRAMYGVGAFVAFPAVVIASSRRALGGKLVVLALSWCFLVFAFTYGNALYVQSQWVDFRITAVINDLDNLEEFVADEPKVVQVKGSVGYSPVLRNQPQDYQMLNRLVPVTFRSEWWWGIAGFAKYYGLPNITYDISSTFDESMPLLENSVYHAIYGDGERFLIVLK